MNHINNPTLESLGLTLPTTTPKSDKLGQEQFFELMVAQLKNQDPTKPLQSGEFLGQLAQFGTVSGINEMQSSIGELSTALRSNQALMASGMVGRTVLAPGEVGTLSADMNMSGALDLPTSAVNVAINITDANGQMVRRLDLGPQAAGEIPFNWDGTTESGAAAVPGRYQVKAQAYSGTESYAVNTYLMTRVDSVSLGNGQDMTLNLSGLGSAHLSDIKRIY